MVTHVRWLKKCCTSKCGHGFRERWILKK